MEETATMRQLFVINSAWIGVRLVVTRPPLVLGVVHGCAAAAGWSRTDDLSIKPQAGRDLGLRIQEYHNPISTPRITFKPYRDHGCPLRSPPSLRDYGELRRLELCDQLMLTTTLHSLPYVHPQDSTRDTLHERLEYWTDLI